MGISLSSVRRWRLTGFGPIYYRVGACCQVQAAGLYGMARIPAERAR
jgi:hypothetical protein